MAMGANKRMAKAARQELYRRLILEAAEASFAERGYEDARIQDIAERAGLSVGTLYATFPGKYEIVRALHEWRLTELLAASTASVQPRAPATEVLLGGTAVLVRWLVDHPAYLRMTLGEGLSWASDARYRSGEQVSAWHQGIALLAALLERGMDEGTIHRGDPQLMAKLLSAAQQVYLANWVDAGMTADPQVLIEHIQQHIRRGFFRRAGEEGQ